MGEALAIADHIEACVWGGHALVLLGSTGPPTPHVTEGRAGRRVRRQSAAALVQPRPIEAARRSPARATIESVEIGGLRSTMWIRSPRRSARLTEFKTALASADGILIATPEYNDGVPGVLINALDWGSRLPGARRWRASPPSDGRVAQPGRDGARAAPPEQVLGHVQARVLPPPELLVARATSGSTRSSA